jgi:hypothetical protein
MGCVITIPTHQRQSQEMGSTNCDMDAIALRFAQSHTPTQDYLFPLYWCFYKAMLNTNSASPYSRFV